ncbi:MAG: gloB [Verrucomicrobia bacterium]|nr:gloB [Verrucomicrobiota bacterium]
MVNRAYHPRMQLEDHVGDVLAKSRSFTGTEPAVLAQAAGLTVAEYAQLEDSGQCGKTPNYAALAKLLQVDAGKLEGLARGWQPQPVDTGTWREIRQITSPAKSMKVHCYLIWDEVTRDAALFDTGTDAEAIFKILDAEQLTLRYIFITHSHWDHVEVLGTIREKHPKARVRSGSKNVPVDQRNRPSECVQLGSLRINHRETPGHCEDGVTYIIGNWPEDASYVAIVGDAIFAGSMGGARQLLDLARQKVREQILTLPEDALICPGHGPLTTVAQEKQHNPFF